MAARALKKGGEPKQVQPFIILNTKGFKMDFDKKLSKSQPPIIDTFFPGIYNYNRVGRKGGIGPASYRVMGAVSPDPNRTVGSA